MAGLYICSSLASAGHLTSCALLIVQGILSSMIGSLRAQRPIQKLNADVNAQISAELTQIRIMVTPFRPMVIPEAPPSEWR